jgi:hypothetical protein
MKTWHDFLDSLDSDGGHLALMVFLMIVGVVAFRHGYPKADDVIIGAFGALLGALKGVGSNKDRSAKVTTVEQTKTETP